MKEWHIITDSSSDIFDLKEEHDNIDYESVPFVINVDDREFIDDETLFVPELVTAMKASSRASHTACPSPQKWYEHFKKGGKIFVVTISKELSGSYNSAYTARHMALEDDPDAQIYIVNSRSTGPGLLVIIDELVRLIEEGLDFEDICKRIEEYIDHSYTVFALCSFDSLVKNGRVSKFSGFVAGRLNIWGIGIGTRDGKIEIKSKVRGKVRAINAIVNDVKEKMILPKRLLISHCLNEEAAEEIKDKVLDYSPETDVVIYKTRGLDTFYAEHQGVIVAYII